MSDDIQDVEFEIRRIAGGRFEAVLHIYRPDRGWRVDKRICASELQAMSWINARLALRGFSETYPMLALKSSNVEMKERNRPSGSGYEYSAAEMADAATRPGTRALADESGVWSRDEPLRTDIGTLTLHWATALAFILSLLTKVRVQAARPERRQGIFTAVAGVLFGSGVLLLFFALYHQGAGGALFASLFMFVGTIVCWIYSAISPPAR